DDVQLARAAMEELDSEELDNSLERSAEKGGKRKKSQKRSARAAAGSARSAAPEKRKTSGRSNVLMDCPACGDTVARAGTECPSCGVPLGGKRRGGGGLTAEQKKLVGRMATIAGLV